MTGNEALTEIRKSDKRTPIVMLTSVAEESMVKECSDAGILGYILKPLNTDNGPSMLSSMLDKVG
jgi:DNA-binding NarL/FixJ family response regulator